MVAFAIHGIALAGSMALQEQVLQVHLDIAKEALKHLVQRTNGFVPASLTSESGHFPAIGLRLEPGEIPPMGAYYPEFSLKLDCYHPEEAWEGVRELRLQYLNADPGGLCSYAAAWLASVMGVPCPLRGQALVKVNGREVGLYTLIEESAGAVIARHFGQQSTGSLFTVQEWLASSTPSTTSVGIPACFPDMRQTDLSLTALQAHFDLQALANFLAWESFTRHTSGYADTGSNCWIYAGDPVAKLRLVPRNLNRLFVACQVPALAQKNGPVARALLASGAGRREFLNALGRMVQDSQIETQLLAAVRQRAEALSSLAVGFAEYHFLNLQARQLLESLPTRFASVRQELLRYQHLSDQELRALVLPQVIELPSTTVAPATPSATNGATVATSFLSLVAKSQTLTSSLPAKLYEVRLSAQTGVLENLTWQAKDWVQASVASPLFETNQVSVRIKGASTRRNFRAKPSLTFKYNSPGASGEKRLFKLHFHNALFNPSFVNEYCAYWLFHRAGLVCPEVNFARLCCNGRDYGLYVVVGGVSPAFLESAFGETNGLLFEGELGDIDRNLATKYHAPPAGYNGLKGLFQQAQAARATHSLGGLAAWVEPGQVARFMALEVALGHEDGYTIHANNFMMYHSPRSHCFFLLPHGLDNLNYNLAGGAYPPMLGQLATALLAAPEGRDLYRKALRRVLAQDMDLDQLQIDLAVLTRQLQPVLQQSEPLWAERQLQGAVALVSGLWRRRAALLEDLNHE